MGVIARVLKITEIAVLGLFGCLVVMIAIGAVVTNGDRSQPLMKVASVPSPAHAPPRSESVTIFLEPRDLIDAYKGNELRGDAKFKGKRVQVTGRVRAVDRHLGDVMIGFGSGFDRVSAYIQKSEEDKAIGINKGETNSVQCTVQGVGVMGGVMLKDCIIVWFVH